MPRMLGNKVFIDRSTANKLRGKQIAVKLKDNPSIYYYGTFVSLTYRGVVLFEEGMQIPLVKTSNIKEVRICKHQTT